jgi:hypothetical protein
MDNLAIFSGCAGRMHKEFIVEHPVMAIEGTASKMNKDWEKSIGGPGGATQIFLPYCSLFALRPL